MKEEELQQLIAETIYEELSGQYGDFKMPMDAAQAIIDKFQLEVQESPGGISDYTSSGKPVVQPDRWSVVGEKWFDAAGEGD